MRDSNLRRHSHQIYSLTPLTARETPLALAARRASGGIRTHDLLITNQLLCQLSYASLFFNTSHQATATTPADSKHGEYRCRANSKIYATIVAPQGGLALRPPNRDKKIREAVESHRKDTQNRSRVRFARGDG